LPRILRFSELLAVDIGAHSIKLCLARMQGGMVRVEKLIDVPTPVDSVREGIVLDSQLIGKLIKEAVQRNNLRAKTTLLTIGGPQVTARPVRLPPMSEEVLSKSIQFEAGRYLPSATEDHYVGFEILSDEGEQMDVLIVAAPRSMVESKTNALQAANLETEIVEMEAFALQRVVQLTNTEWVRENKAVALIDLGGNHTQVTVISGHTFALTRYIPIGGETFTAALKGYFHYSTEEAEQIKSHLNLADLVQPPAEPQENPPLRLLQPILDELVREIRRSLNYYQSQMGEEGSKTNRIDQISLSGGTALMKGIDIYFGQKLNVATEIINPLTSNLMDMSRLHPEQILLGTRYSTVVGSVATLNPDALEEAA
jgi:type IV pilus assembly protein PilM